MQTALNRCLWEVLFPAMLLPQFVQRADVLGAFSNLQPTISTLQTENKGKWQQGMKNKLILMLLFGRESGNKITGIIGRLVTTAEFLGFQRCESTIGKIIWVPILSSLCDNAWATMGKNANSSNSNCNNKYDRNCLKNINLQVRASQNSYSERPLEVVSCRMTEHPLQKEGFRCNLLCGTPAWQHSKAPSCCGSEGNMSCVQGKAQSLL